MAHRIAHLPAGHQPGPQSRRVARSSPFAVMLLGVCALGFLGGAIALYAGRNSGSRSGHEVGAAVLAGAALVMVAFTWWVYRRGIGGGRRARGVELEVERGEVRRGDQLPVTLRINSAEIGQRQLQVGLVCTRYGDVKKVGYNQYGSYEHRVTEPTNVVEDWRDVAAGGATQSFTFTIPADGPFSYEGDTVSYAYRVSAREPTRLRADPHRDVPIWVAP